MMAPNNADTQAADFVRESDRDRWLTAQLAPPGARTSLLALYAFHAEVAKTRDVVSDPVVGDIRLRWWRETVEGASQGAPRDHPVAQALAASLATHRLAAADLVRLVDAREADLSIEGFATEAEFIAYLDATAGALHHAALGALGAAGEVILEASDHVSRAYGIAGQMRAAAVNAARGRVLLPLDLLAAHGVTVAALRAGRPETGLRDVARQLAARASRELAAARALRSATVRAALPVLALARFADHHLRRVAAADYDLFSGRLEPVPISGPLAVLRVMVSGRY